MYELKVGEKIVWVIVYNAPLSKKHFVASNVPYGFRVLMCIFYCFHIFVLIVCSFELI